MTDGTHHTHHVSTVQLRSKQFSDTDTLLDGWIPYSSINFSPAFVVFVSPISRPVRSNNECRFHFISFHIDPIGRVGWVPVRSFVRSLARSIAPCLAFLYCIVLYCMIYFSCRPALHIFVLDWIGLDTLYSISNSNRMNESPKPKLLLLLLLFNAMRLVCAPPLFPFIDRCPLTINARCELQFNQLSFIHHSSFIIHRTLNLTPIRHGTVPRHERSGTDSGHVD